MCWYVRGTWITMTTREVVKYYNKNNEIINACIWFYPRLIRRKIIQYNNYHTTIAQNYNYTTINKKKIMPELYNNYRLTTRSLTIHRRLTQAQEHGMKFLRITKIWNVGTLYLASGHCSFHRMIGSVVIIGEVVVVLKTF